MTTINTENYKNTPFQCTGWQILQHGNVILWQCLQRWFNYFTLCNFLIHKLLLDVILSKMWILRLNMIFKGQIRYHLMSIWDDGKCDIDCKKQLYITVNETKKSGISLAAVERDLMETVLTYSNDLVTLTLNVNMRKKKHIKILN